MNPSERARPTCLAPWGPGLSVAFGLLPSAAGQAADLRLDLVRCYAEDPQVAARGCTAGDRGDASGAIPGMTRREAAALRNDCLGGVDGLAPDGGGQTATRFSTTTTLRGHHTFVIGAVRARGDAAGYNQRHGAATFSHDQRLELWTSFTGKDLLRR